MCEKSKRRCTEREAEKNRCFFYDSENHGYAENCRAYNDKTHNRAAAEADEERGLDILCGCFGRSAVGKRSYDKTELTRNSGKNRTADVSDSHSGVLPERFGFPDRRRKEQKDDDRDNCRENGKNLVFSLHKGVRTFADELSNFGNSLVFLRLLLYPDVKISCEQEGDSRRDDRNAVK